MEFDSNSSQSEAIRADIPRRIAAGQSDAEIRAYYVTRYSEKILETPSNSGLGIVAWGLPALALMWRSGLTTVALVHAALLQLAYVPDPRIAGRDITFAVLDPTQRLRFDLVYVWAPVVVLGLFVAVVAMSATRPKWSLANVPVNARSHTTRADSTTPAPSSRRQPTRT